MKRTMAEVQCDPKLLQILGITPVEGTDIFELYCNVSINHLFTHSFMF
jgi:hypothetical protein